MDSIISTTVTPVEQTETDRYIAVSIMLIVRLTMI